MIVGMLVVGEPTATGDEECQRLQRHGATVENLRQLLQAFEQLQRQQLRNANQLRQIVKQYYPLLLSLFSDVATNISLAFLQTYPGPQDAQQLHIRNWSNFSIERYPYMKRLDILYRRLRQTPLQATV